VIVFNPFMARCVKRLVDGGLIGRVIEFGNQRYGAKGVVKGTEKATTTEQFYKALGFTEYVAIDVNNNMGAVIADLNEPISSHIIGKYDLVTNNGTGEHLFDQCMVFTNAHDLCKLAGVMLHVLPFSPWINHGFYSYNPILFRDLAAANGYRIMFISIDHRNGGNNDVLGNAEPWLYQEKNPEGLIAFMNKKRAKAPTPDLLLGVALQKQSADPFRKPLQGKYQTDVASVALRDKYRPVAP
jgi:hypothetical protein